MADTVPASCRRSPSATKELSCVRRRVTQDMRKFGKTLIESMQQAAKHAAGRRVRELRVSKVELPGMKAIRLPCACRNITWPPRARFRFPP
jgi:hypothetical protein